MLTRYGVPALALVSLLFASVSVIRHRTTGALVAPPVDPGSSRFATAIAGTGIVEARSENVAISTPIAGLVSAVYVAPGARVSRGDPLFLIDDRGLAAELAVRASVLRLSRARLERLRAQPRPEDLPPLRARVRQCEAQLADASLQLERYEKANRAQAGTVKDEDLTTRRTAVELARARLDETRADLATLEAGAWSRELSVAGAEVEADEARVEQARVELDRLTVRAPFDGEVLQVKVRAGEYAPGGQLPVPLVLLGATDVLHVRVAVDEYEAPRVAAEAPAEAVLRGDSRRRAPLRFVRFEPYVLPKQSLTNAVSERVDTRVLEVIYALEPGALPVRVGQQVDVFIENRS